MSARALRRARVARGLVVSASGAVLGLGAHLLAGGSLVSPVLLLLLALAAGACTLASDRAWSLPRLLVALGGIQLGVHEVMSLQMGSGAGTTSGSAAAASAAAPAIMIAGHACAALAMAWVLRQGEALFWRLVQRLGPRRFWPTVTGVFHPAAPHWRSTGPAPARGPRPLAGALARRGPPTLTLA
jgi:hypothetical protein